MTMDNYAAGIMLDADPPCEKCERLHDVVVQARDLCVWLRQFEPYLLSSRARKQLTALETAITSVLNDGKGDPCPTMPPPAPAASVAPQLFSGTEYQETVAAIAQRLSGKPVDAQPSSQTMTNDPSPSAESTYYCAMVA